MFTIVNRNMHTPQWNNDRLCTVGEYILICCFIACYRVLHIWLCQVGSGGSWWSLELKLWKFAVGRWDRKLNPGLVLTVATVSLNASTLFHSEELNYSTLGQAEFPIKICTIDCRWFGGYNHQNMYDCKISTLRHTPFISALVICIKCSFKRPKLGLQSSCCISVSITLNYSFSLSLSFWLFLHVQVFLIEVDLDKSWYLD